MRKGILLFLMVFLTTTKVFAQDDITIKSFLPNVNDLTARTNPRKTGAGKPCALVKVVLADQGVTFECGNLASMIVGDVSFHTNEYWVYLVAGESGAKHLKVKHPQFPTIDVTFADYGFKTLEALTTYTLVLKKNGGLMFSKHNQFYVDAFFQAGGLIGPGIAIGGHFHAINAELEMTKGVTKSDVIFWYDKNNLIAQTSYSALSGNVKLGYGFQFGKKYFITPQVGFGLVKCSFDGNNPGSDANASFGLIGCRGNLIFAKHLQIVVAPYYNFAIKKSSSFEEISEAQSSIKNWASGFNIKVGLSIFF